MKNNNPKIDFSGAHFLKNPNTCFLKFWGVMLQTSTQRTQFEASFQQKSKNGLLSASPSQKSKNRQLLAKAQAKTKKPALYGKNTQTRNYPETSFLFSQLTLPILNL